MMSKPPRIQGVTADLEHTIGDISYKRVSQWAEVRTVVINPITFGVMTFGLGLIGFLITPAFLEFFLLPQLALLLPVYRNSHRKMKHTVEAPVDDRNIPPDERGIFYLGNDRFSKEEIWFSESDVRTHFMMLGTTGSGKTEMIISFCANSMMWGSGFVLIDGKGARDVFAKIYSLARQFGRDDDMFALNYLGNSDDVDAVRGKSNTFNPIFNLKEQEAIQFMMNLIAPEGGSEGGNKIFSERAEQVIKAIIPILVYERKHFGGTLSFKGVRELTHLQALVKKYFHMVKHNYSERVIEGLKAYMASYPGVEERAWEKWQKQYENNETIRFDPKTTEQHAYVTMHLTKPLGIFEGVYGYIYQHPHSDVNMADIVLNRRILVIMLPTLSNSEEETSILGRVALAALQSMMGEYLGSEIEGDYQDVMVDTPTYSETPFICLFDELSAYINAGINTMVIQGRSLGLSMVVCTQDIAGVQKNPKIKAIWQQIQGSCNIKIFGKLEEMTETFEFAQKNGGKVRVRIQTRGSDSDDRNEFRFEYVDRIDANDIKAQNPGESHTLFKGHLIRLTHFYANPAPAKRLVFTRLVALEHYSAKDFKPLPEEQDKKRMLAQLINKDFLSFTTQDKAKEEMGAIGDFGGVLANYPYKTMGERAIVGLSVFYEAVRHPEILTQLKGTDLEEAKREMFLDKEDDDDSGDQVTPTTIGDARKLPDVKSAISSIKAAPDTGRKSISKFLLENNEAEKNAQSKPAADAATTDPQNTDSKADINNALLAATGAMSGSKAYTPPPATDYSEDGDDDGEVEIIDGEEVDKTSGKSSVQLSGAPTSKQAAKNGQATAKNKPQSTAGTSDVKSPSSDADKSDAALPKIALSSTEKLTQELMSNYGTSNSFNIEETKKRLNEAANSKAAAENTQAGLHYPKASEIQIQNDRKLSQIKTRKEVFMKALQKEINIAQSVAEELKKIGKN